MTAEFTHLMTSFLSNIQQSKVSVIECKKHISKTTKQIEEINETIKKT